MTLRILHIVGGMNRAGVETWLMQVLRRVDRSSVAMDFLVHTTHPGDYDAEIRSLGSHLFPCLHHRNPFAYGRAFRRIVRTHGPYDIVHSHLQHFGGHVLRLANAAGVPVRIAHSHSDTRPAERSAPLLRRGYVRLMEKWIDRHATHGLAVSGLAAEGLFGPGWRHDPRWGLHPCGVDLEPFRAPIGRSAIRAQLGIPRDAFVLGHAGRFHELKNHLFLLEVAAETLRREPRTFLLLVGDGPLRPRIERRVRDLGLSGRALLVGVRNDIPSLMIGAMDVFVFPSRAEGFGLALLEAQAAGLPCVYSDSLPEEVALLEPLLVRRSLSAPPARWAEAIIEAAGRPRPSPGETSAALRDGPFDIATSAARLVEFYHATV